MLVVVLVLLLLLLLRLSSWLAWHLRKNEGMLLLLFHCVFYPARLVSLA